VAYLNADTFKAAQNFEKSEHLFATNTFLPVTGKDKRDKRASIKRRTIRKLRTLRKTAPIRLNVNQRIAFLITKTML
jgi:hypothetical protein